MHSSYGRLRTLMTVPGCALVLALPSIAHAQGPNHYYNFDEGSGTIAHDSGLTGGANATVGGSWSTTTPFSYSGNRSVTPTASPTTAPGFLVSPQFTLSLWGLYTPNAASQYFLDSNGTGRTLIYNGSELSASQVNQIFTSGSLALAAPTPEPGSIAFLITLGVAGTGLITRRGRKTKRRCRRT